MRGRGCAAAAALIAQAAAQSFRVLRIGHVQPTAHRGQALSALVCALGQIVRSRSFRSCWLGRFRVRTAFTVMLGSGLPVAVRGHGGVCGRADHDPDHGFRVSIVTVVGGSWSVVRSGAPGFLKVSKYTF
ncbi:hypothetical protein BM536_038210 [Streptomyces phaeoluteigriseus]|uniref:Uncharacterized protein n=1 Tax=Streptomyces phaeoluteigriseus TaxID=114686 RepID=A0A1V6MHF5_9ACTN|nr:hypothetical protein BM536_038210 [Streptomyces phaeoluteigriseus]